MLTLLTLALAADALPSRGSSFWYHDHASHTRSASDSTATR